MAKAPANEQLKLLQLAALDSRATALSNEIRATQEDARLPGLREALEAARAQDAQATAETQRVASALKSLEEEVDALQSRISRNNERMNAGGLSKDLVAQQKENEALQASKDEHEERELELMEEQETVTEAQQATSAALSTAQADLAALQDNIKDEVAGLAEQRDAVLAERESFATSVEPALLEIYRKTRERRGIGAARLFHGRSEGSGMDLSPGDLAEVRAAAEDEVVFCPDSGVILVRSPEWN